MGVVPEDCFAKTGKSYLVAINAVFGIFSLLLCAGGSYLWIEYENKFQGLVSTAPIIGIMILGFLFFLLSMAGIYGAMTGKKIVLGTYLFVIVIFVAIEVAAAIIFLQYLKVLNASESTASNELRDQAEIFINNFIFRSYETCCVTDPANCGQFPAALDPIFCKSVQICGSGSNSTSLGRMSSCIVDSSANPVKTIEKGVCTALKSFTTDGKPLVGKAIAGNTVTCGGGDPANFEVAFTDWLKSNINFFGYGALGVGLTELFIVVFTVALLLTNPDFIPKAIEVNEEAHESDPRPVSLAMPIPQSPSNRNSVSRNSVNRSSVNRNSVNRNRMSYRSDYSAGSGQSGSASARVSVQRLPV